MNPRTLAVVLTQEPLHPGQAAPQFLADAGGPQPQTLLALDPPKFALAVEIFGVEGVVFPVVHLLAAEDTVRADVYQPPPST